MVKSFYAALHKRRVITSWILVLYRTQLKFRMNCNETKYNKNKSTLFYKTDSIFIIISLRKSPFFPVFPSHQTFFVKKIALKVLKYWLTNIWCILKENNTMIFPHSITSHKACCCYLQLQLHCKWSNMSFLRNSQDSWMPQGWPVTCFLVA